MDDLQQIYASPRAGDLLYITLSIEASVIDGGVMHIVQGYDDVTATLETGETVTFTARALGLQLPGKSSQGREELQFQVDDVLGEVEDLADALIESGEKATVTLRLWANDLTAPAKPPLKMTYVSASFAANGTASLVAAQRDIVNRAWPRRRFTAELCPGLKYYGS